VAKLQERISNASLRRNGSPGSPLPRAAADGVSPGLSIGMGMGKEKKEAPSLGRGFA
jgi:hypothetical protein